tara:strand:- start:5624 stop:7156 length:1533 start_codon:yes stop_codon:yes gene_type:complete
MKNYKYLYFLLIATFIGCSDLEEEPVGLLSPDGFFKSPADIQTAVNGAIGNMASEAYWGRKLTVSLLLRGDMATIGDQGTSAARKEVNYFQMNDASGMVSEFWPRSYEVIASANEAIAGAEFVDAAPENKSPITAQAYFIRAFAYYHLVRVFGEVPYLDQPVINVDDTKTISKTSVADVYTHIIADLEEAKTWLPNVQPIKALPSKATASAYLASVYLTLGEFKKAYDEAKYVIDNEGLFNLNLEPDFQNLFDADKQDALKEPLFVIDFNGFQISNYGMDYMAPITGIRQNQRLDGRADIGEGWSVAVPSIEVYNRWDGRDYRKAVSLDTTAVFDGVTQPFSYFPTGDSRNIASAYIAKYTRFPGVTGGANGRASSINYATMRYAEVLLIAAEALNEITPGTTEADSYINRIRLRARNKAGVLTSFPEDVTSGLSKDAFRDMVLEERRIELAFEFKRWYDIKRRQLGTDVFGPTGLEPQVNFDPSRDYLFPLPGDELQRNPNLAPNNPGY